MTSPSVVPHLRWAEIDAAALRHNAATVRAMLAPETSLLAMVKADGYGHGASLAARAALDGGASWLGVYTPSEALALRADGFTDRVLVCGWTPPDSCASLVRAGVDITVFDVAAVHAVAGAAADAGVRARVHVKIDSGLGRLGVRDPDLEAVTRALAQVASSVQVAGIFTHFADADNDPSFTLDQHVHFLRCVETLRSVAPDALLHTCGSAGVLRFPELHHDLVRVGIALYGYDPRGGPPRVAVQPAMSVFARVAQVKTVDAGDSVGYGRTWRARRRSRIATVAIGYGQGLSRALSNRGWIVVREARAAIVGTVSMDQVTVDVSDVDGVAQGDTAMVFGRSGAARLGADEVAGLLGTISYEVLCAAGQAVPRVAAGSAHGAEAGGVTAVP